MIVLLTLKLALQPRAIYAWCQQPIATSVFTMTTTGFVMSHGGWKGVLEMVREAEGDLVMGGMFAFPIIGLSVVSGTYFPHQKPNPKWCMQPIVLLFKGHSMGGAIFLVGVDWS